MSASQTPLDRHHIDEDRHDGGPRFLVHEFFVDFLGGLVPGILFVVAATFALVPPLWALMKAIANGPPSATLSGSIAVFLSATQHTPNMIWIAAFIFVLIFSYVLGHVFYRRDPKIPDIKSFHRISREKPSTAELKQSYNGSAEEWQRKSFACITDDDCQFPYAYLADYLSTRGHKHLADLLTWQDEIGNRSKTFINRLKIRLDFHFPHKYRRIIRNEAHVRLATSTWYVGRSLIFVCATTIPIALVSIGIALWRRQFQHPEDVLSWYASPVICPFLVLILAWYCRRSTEHFIHYQRLREAFYVLELAYTAFRHSPELLNSPGIIADVENTSVRSAKGKSRKKVAPSK